MLFFLKWFGLIWTICAIGIVALSNVMIVNKWAPLIVGVLPYDVQDSLRVAMLLAPGAIAVVVHLVLEKRKVSLHHVE
jgi:hypothetical protein